jgi:hypothetical protein
MNITEIWFKNNYKTYHNVIKEAMSNYKYMKRHGMFGYGEMEEIFDELYQQGGDVAVDIMLKRVDEFMMKQLNKFILR